MTDHYKISLIILKQLLEESGHSNWVNWIEKDIQAWETKKDTKHHLSAYGGMGSLNDLYVGGTDKLGIWKSQLFDIIKNLTLNLASQKMNAAPTSQDFYLYGTGEMSGWRCRDCGYSRLNEKQIECYLSYKYLPLIITELIQKNKLENIINLRHWVDTKEVETERNSILNHFNLSEIEVCKAQCWLENCPKCKSDDVCVYRWKWDEIENKIIESKNNLDIKYNQQARKS